MHSHLQVEIARRELRSEPPADVSLVVRLFRPSLLMTADYSCVYEISFGEGEAIRRSAVGIDSMQALHWALRLIGNDLEIFYAERGWKFVFGEQEFGGFPKTP